MSQNYEEDIKRAHQERVNAIMSGFIPDKVEEPVVDNSKTQEESVSED